MGRTSVFALLVLGLAWGAWEAPARANGMAYVHRSGASGTGEVGQAVPTDQRAALVRDGTAWSLILEPRYERPDAGAAWLVPFAHCPTELRPSCAVYEKYTAAFAGAAEQVLRKYGRGVVEKQTELKRLADIAIDLFVGLTVMSRAAALGEADPERREQVHAMAATFTQQAKRRMAGNLRRLEHSEDAELDKLAASVLADGGYRWDILSG